MKETSPAVKKLIDDYNRIAADNKQLREALQEIKNLSIQWDSDTHNKITAISIKALNNTK